MPVLPPLDLASASTPARVVCVASSSQTASEQADRLADLIERAQSAANRTNRAAQFRRTFPSVRIENSVSAAAGFEPVNFANPSSTFTSYPVEDALDEWGWLELENWSSVRRGSEQWWLHANYADESQSALQRVSASVSHIDAALGELQDGWNGSGSLAPSVAVRSDVALTLGAASVELPSPQIEVDDDGTVALIWDHAGHSHALTFLGNGKVIGTISPSADVALWEQVIVDRPQIAERIAHFANNLAQS
ncbi:MAG TPA: hypothetical protein VK533_00225 [Sphingomonas sp.]|uniref:hypothetical protein n=1 Tax=Sphingomonas sp. TaxID=28214 RepID=UPI002C0E63CC|nr:hypothetical protein [Sphingomonas sp.]HMI17943.1 hypothetical protein [Sphingomonas sp.]